MSRIFGTAAWMLVLHAHGHRSALPQEATSKPNPEHPVFPYLLRNAVIERPNQVWCTDISYIPMRHGFLYLFAVLDWTSRKMLAWRLSYSLTTDFCIDAVEEAIAAFGGPEIFDPDPGFWTAYSRKVGKTPIASTEALPVRKRHSPEQIAAVLRAAEAGTPVAEIIRKLSIHENTFYTWKRRFGGLGTPEIRELRQLREENAKLKSIVADLSLDRKMLQEIISKKL
jgi:transposase InsO family protein